MFAIINRHGLRFTIKAESHASACLQLMLILGKRSIPAYFDIVEA